MKNLKLWVHITWSQGFSSRSLESFKIWLTYLKFTKHELHKSIHKTHHDLTQFIEILKFIETFEILGPWPLAPGGWDPGLGFSASIETYMNEKPSYH